MIDINPESSISTSRSNSVASKSSNTDDNTADATHSVARRSVASTRHDSEEAAISGDIGSVLPILCHISILLLFPKLVKSILSNVGDILSPCDSHCRSQTVSDPKQPCTRSGSNISVQSCASIISFDSQPDNETMHFMRRFVSILFRDSSLLTLELKSEFGRKTRVS